MIRSYVAFLQYLKSRNKSLKGKTREEMGLEPFRGEEIRSSVLGIPVAISVNTIAGVIRRASGGKYIFGLKGKKSSWIPIVNQTLYNSSTKGRYKDMDTKTKLLLKIQSENLLPKGSGGDKPSLDHKVFLHFFVTKERTNVPKYIFKHLIKNLEDSQTIKKNFVPYGRLLSEIFHQIGVLDALKSVNCYTDAQLSTVTGRIINGATMVTMKLIRKEDHQELRSDLKESSVISNLMDDFPPICKQDPLEVRVMFIKEYYESTGHLIKISDIPDEMYGGALPIARNRKSLKRKMSEAEYMDATPEIDAKVAKISAPESTAVAEVSEASAQVTQTSNLPLNPTPVSPSHDSDLDDVPISQRMRNLSKPSSQPQHTTPQLPPQAEQSLAAAECTEDPKDPPASDLP